MMDFDKALQDFLSAIEGDSHPFSETLAFIERWFVFRPTAFRIGPISNSAEQNQGSCRVLSMARLQGLSQAQALRCFGEHYRAVLATPEVDNHHNLRRLQSHGLADVVFEQAPLRRK